MIVAVTGEDVPADFEQAKRKLVRAVLLGLYKTHEDPVLACDVTSAAGRAALQWAKPHKRFWPIESKSTEDALALAHAVCLFGWDDRLVDEGLRRGLDVWIAREDGSVWQVSEIE